jgi:hypothetical protein
MQQEQPDETRRLQPGFHLHAYNLAQMAPLPQ